MIFRSRILLTSAVFLLLDLGLRLFLASQSSPTFFAILLSVVASLSFWATLADIQSLCGKRGQQLFAVLVTTFVVGLMVTSVFTLWKLGDYINAYMLMFISVDRGFVPEQIRLYGFDYRVLLLVPIWILLYSRWNQPLSKLYGWRRGFRVGRILVMIVILLTALNQLKYEAMGQHKTPDAAFLLAVKAFQKSTRLNVLRSSIRQKVRSVQQKGQRPDIFIFLGESLGRQYLKVFGNSIDAAPQMSEFFSSGNSFRFQQAITNSSCTDVSLPSLFSGVGPEEDDQKLHEVPLIWDWLRAQGYHTIFASPQKFAFANFDSFILSPGPDQYLSADRFNNFGRMLTSHNNGLDDIWAAKKVVEELQGVPKEKPVALIFFTNATHYPFLQTSTELGEQPSFQDPYMNSLWITDQAFFEITKGFGQFRDPANLLSLVSADHGELVQHVRPVPRIASFYDEILGAPLMIRLPQKWDMTPEKDKSCRQGLLLNQDRLVSNMDVLPTLVELLSLDEDSQNATVLARLRGQSLCRDVGDERAVIALNTNNIRQWNPEGFLIARGHGRLVFSNTEGLQYFDVSTDPGQKQNLVGTPVWREQAQFYQKIVEENIQLKRIQNLYLKKTFTQEP